MAEYCFVCMAMKNEVHSASRQYMLERIGIMQVPSPIQSDMGRRVVDHDNTAQRRVC